MKQSLLTSVAMHLLLLAALGFGFSATKTTNIVRVNLLTSASADNYQIRAGLINRPKQQATKPSQPALDRPQNNINSSKEPVLTKPKANSSVTKTKPATAKNTKAPAKALNSKTTNLTKEQSSSSKQVAEGLKSDKDVIAATHDLFLQSELERYQAEFSTLITANRVTSSAFGQELYCTFRLKLAADGKVDDLIIERSSGNSAYDSMSSSAVYRAAPFPMPKDKELNAQLREIVINFRNDD